MLLTGLISILQVIFIPGFILVSIFKIKTDSYIQKWLYIFSISLFLNYGLVTLLTLLAIYSFYAMWGILIFELLIIILFCRKEFFKIFSIPNFSEIYIESFEFLKSTSILDRTLIIISGLIVLFYLSVFLANIGTIFYFTDTVNNYEWNRWAIDFAHNILPKYSSHFPQLIPANWSICYVMIGKTNVHFFPKSIMPLFFLSNVLIFVDLAFRSAALGITGEKRHLNLENSKVFLIGLIIYGLFAPIIYSLVFIADGNADLPVSFFPFLTFYAFIIGIEPSWLIMQNSKNIKFNQSQPIRKEDLNINSDQTLSHKEGLNFYLLTFLFASMAAATKLAGFYTFTIVLLILGMFLLLRRKKLNYANTPKIILIGLAISMISLFWYFRAPDVMYSGLDQPQYLAAKNYTAIFINALKLMYYNFGPPVFLFLIITIIASIFNKKYRYISILMVLIPTFIWMLKFSSDFRNLSFVVPFLALSSAIGLFKIIEFIKSSNPNNLNTEYTSKSPNVNKKRILKPKEKLLLIFLSALSTIMLLIFISDKFYVFLHGIYGFINKYYFQSHRIINFIEFGFLLHVDFYQRVLIVLSIILIIIPLLILTKIRFKIIIMLIVSGVIFLNFTFIKETTILKHQIESFSRVDARNYYEWLNTIVKRKGLQKAIYSNFEFIIDDKIPRDIHFKYIKNVSTKTLQNIKEKNCYLFLKLDLLKPETKTAIKSCIKRKEYDLLLEDNRYIFFMVNPS